MSGPGRAVDAVLLDVGGVFLLPDPAILAAALGPWAPGLTTGDLRRSHYAGIAAMDTAAFLAVGAAVAGGLSVPTPEWASYEAGMLASLGIDDVGPATEAMVHGFSGLRWNEVIPGSLDALRRLADTGVALGVVSNSDGTAEEQLLAARICQVGAGEGVPVTVVLDSHVVGVEKPDPAIFAHALSALGVPADRAMHVGDTGWADVVGARAAGVRPVHLDPYGFCPHPDDHDHAADLDGVVALVTA